MNDLDKYREQINIIDAQIAFLFEKRMQLSSNIAEYKKKNNLPIYDKLREDIVINNNLSLIEDNNLKEYYKKLLTYIMKLSKEYQHDITNESDIISVNTYTSSYDVIMKEDCFNELDKYFNLNRRVLIVADENLPKKFIDKIVSKCSYPVIYLLKASESGKSLETCNILWELMLKNDFNRHDCIVACGGGVIGDLCGFVASTYMRGIDFYNIPSTVLSQVDASIGGKTAINYDKCKNIIGSFYQPKTVLIDINLLQSLDIEQVNNGLAEALKMAVLIDGSLFELFQKGTYLDNMNIVIFRSLLNKRKIVQDDEKENGIRKILNFGHTIGHGIESMNYGLYHGQCVALGMLCMCSSKLYKKLIPIYNRLNLPINIELDIDKVMQFIAHDKKSIDNGIEIVFANEVEDYEIKKVDIKYLKDRLKIIQRGREV